MFTKQGLCARGGLLLGGLFCLALAAPLTARAAAPNPGDSPKVLVQKLESAVRAADDKALAAILSNESGNQGREELLASSAVRHASGVLESMLDERFGPGEVVETGALTNARIEIIRQAVDCGVTVMQLRVALQKGDGTTAIRELPCAVDLDGKSLFLPEGFSGLSAEDSRALTDLLHYEANLYEKTAREIGEGKYQNREEALQAIAEELGQSEPMQRYMTQVAGPALAKVVAQAIDEAFKKVLADTARKGVQP
jgi:hypothetical protein